MNENSCISLVDPCVFRYIFLSRWHLGDDNEHKRLHWDSIKETVRQSWEWSHQCFPSLHQFQPFFSTPLRCFPPRNRRENNNTL